MTRKATSASRLPKSTHGNNTGRGLTRNRTNQWEGKKRKVWLSLTCAPFRPRRFLAFAPAVLLASCLVVVVRAETPKAADFPELAAAYRPVRNSSPVDLCRVASRRTAPRAKGPEPNERAGPPCCAARASISAVSGHVRALPTRGFSGLPYLNATASSH